MRIWLQIFVSIQLKTSLKKSDVSWLMRCWSGGARGHGGPRRRGAPRQRGASRAEPRHITLSEPRSRLYQHRSLQVNSHNDIFQHFKAIFQHLQDFHNSAPLESQNFQKSRQNFRDFEEKFIHF